MTTLSFLRTEVLALLNNKPGEAYSIAMRDVQRAMVSEAMVQSRGNQTCAAVLLGMSRATLRSHLARMEGSYNGS